MKKRSVKVEHLSCEQHHDIIQQDFLDTYNNLTLKTLMGMSWVASYCSDTRFAMKTDSDVFVNTMHLIEKLLRPLPPPTQNYFTGHLMAGNSPIRNKASKWYISEEEFPGNRYHPFCSGTGYVFSGDLAAKIVEASLMIKFIHLEDVYVGFCLHAKGVEIVPPPYSLFNIRKHQLIFKASKTISTLLKKKQRQCNKTCSFIKNE
uniref:Hexosyltransferase n=1 Tax=Geospiza parvula TaxID=87175 RepID=A0A8C3NJ92_GEOPR